MIIITIRIYYNIIIIYFLFICTIYLSCLLSNLTKKIFFGLLFYQLIQRLQI